MGPEELRNALRGTSEVELTVTGRVSGRESTRPVWFVEEGQKVFLLPVGGSDNNWFKNVLKTPRIALAAGGAEFRANAKPLEDPAAVGEVVQKFRKTYGADRVTAYYPKQDAAVEVPLSERIGP